MMSILAFVFGVLILVSVHEWGHYRVAKAFGVGVKRFSIGFGAPVWRWQKSADATEFVIARWPLGGYVRMLDESEGDVPAHQRHQAFNRQPLYVRAAVVAAGPLVNILFAFAVYAAVQWMGQDQLRPIVATPPVGSLAAQAGVQAGDWVRDWRVGGEPQAEPIESLEQLRWQVAQALGEGQDVSLGLAPDEHAPVRHVMLPMSKLDQSVAQEQMWLQVGLGMPWMPAVIREVMPDGAAARAGLRAGDLVRAIDGQAIADVQALRQRIRHAIGAQGAGLVQRWELKRSGQTVVLEVQPEAVNEDGRMVGRLGVMLGEPPASVFVRAGWLDGVAQAWRQTSDVALMSWQTFGRMLTGSVSWSNVSGPVGVAQVAGASAESGLISFLQFLAFFRVNLAVLNLLPIPLLDGGHLMYYLWEWISGKPVSEAHMRGAQRLGLLLLGALMAIALSNDLTRLLN